MGQKLTTSALSVQQKLKTDAAHQLKDYEPTVPVAEDSVSEDSVQDAQIGPVQLKEQDRASLLNRSLSIEGGDSNQDVVVGDDPDLTVMPVERYSYPILEECGPDQHGFINTKLGFFDAEAFSRDFGLNREDGKFMNSNDEFNEMNEQSFPYFGENDIGIPDADVIDYGQYKAPADFKYLDVEDANYKIPASVQPNRIGGQSRMDTDFPASVGSGPNPAGLYGQMNEPPNCDFNVGKNGYGQVKPYDVDNIPRTPDLDSGNNLMNTAGGWQTAPCAGPNFSGGDLMYPTGSCLPPNI